MRSVCFVLFLMFISNGNKALAQKDTIYTFYVPGPNLVFDYFEINNDRCRIHFYGGGCLTTDSLEKVLEIHNDRTDKALRQRYGENWREIYDSQVRYREEMVEQINSVIEQQEFIKARLADLGMEFDQLQISWISHKRNNWLQVWVSYMKPNDELTSFEEHQLYKLRINLVSAKVRIKNKRDQVIK